jgi:hypothetical protein
VETQEI